MQCFEPALDGTRTQSPPSPHRLGDPLDLDSAEIAVFEKIAEQPASTRSDDDRLRFGQGLEPRREVRSFTDNRLLLGRAFADQVADDHQSGGDPDARLELDRLDIEAADRVDGCEPRPHRPLGIILMRLRVAEIDQHAIAHIPGDEAIEPGDDFADGAVIGGDDLAIILRIEAPRQRGRADEIAEHHCQLTALGIGGSCGRRSRSRPSGRSQWAVVQSGDGGE